MANLKRVRVSWVGGGVVGGGVSTHYFLSSASGFIANLNTFYGAIKLQLPTSVTVNVPNAGETIDEATGQPNGLWSDGTSGSHTGTTSANYAAGVGVRIQWKTLGYNNGRRVTGSTFIVPLPSSAYVADGNINTTVGGALLTAGAALVTAQGTNFVVYSRPKAAGVGSTAAVTQCVVDNHTSWLRTRRT